MKRVQGQKSLPKRPLADLVEVKTGYQFRGASTAKGEVQIPVIQAKDLSFGTPPDSEALERLPFGGNPDWYRVRPGDVLLLSRGPRFSAAAVDRDLEQVIVPHYFFILRPLGEQFVPGYLAWYLSRPEVQAKLTSMATGATMPTISRSALKELEIDLPPLATQEKIAELLRLALQEERLVSELRPLKKQYVNQACHNAAFGRTGKKAHHE